MNWLLNPWIKPKLQITALDEIVGTIEVIVAMGILLVVAFAIKELLMRYK